jgi:hypothetical protein
LARRASRQHFSNGLALAAATPERASSPPEKSIRSHTQQHRLHYYAIVEQVGIRAQTQYKQEYLGTLFTADTLYGVAELRDYASVALAVPV